MTGIGETWGAARGNVEPVTTSQALPAATQRRLVGMLPWVALGVVYVVWGSTYLGIRYAVGSMPPLISAGSRYAVAGLLLCGFLVALRGPQVLRLTRAQFGSAVLVGMLLLFAGNGLVAVAEQHVSSGLTALLIASVPIYIVIMRRIAGDRPRRTTWLGVAIGLVGLALLLVVGSSGGSAGAQGGTWWGPWLVMLAALSWAVGTFASTRLPAAPNPFVMSGVEVLVAGLLTIVIGLVSGERVDVTQVTTGSWIAWGYLVTFGSLGAFCSYIYVLGKLPVSTVATYAYVNPAIAVLLGVLIAGERFGPIQLLGGLVVLVAVVLVVRSERTDRAEHNDRAERTDRTVRAAPARR